MRACVRRRYFLAKIGVDAVTAWVSPIAFVLILYWCMHLHFDAATFFLFLLVFCLTIIGMIRLSVSACWCWRWCRRWRWCWC
jgi:hypothetical protein